MKEVEQEVYEEELTDEMKTSLRLPKSLVKEFKHLATDRETNVTALIVQAMEEFITRAKKK